MPGTILGHRNIEVTAFVNRRHIVSSILGSEGFIITLMFYTSTYLLPVK